MALIFQIDGLHSAELRSFGVESKIDDVQLHKLSILREKLNKSAEVIKGSNLQFKDLTEVETTLVQFDALNKKMAAVYSDILMKIDQKVSLLEVKKVELSIDGQPGYQSKKEEVNETIIKLKQLRKKYVFTNKFKANLELIKKVENEIDEIFKAARNLPSKLNAQLDSLHKQYLNFLAKSELLNEIYETVISLSPLLLKDEFNPEMKKNIMDNFQYQRAFNKRIEFLNDNLARLKSEYDLLITKKINLEITDKEYFEKLQSFELLISNYMQFINETKSKYLKRFQESLFYLLPLLKDKQSLLNLIPLGKENDHLSSLKSLLTKSLKSEFDPSITNQALKDAEMKRDEIVKFLENKVI